MILTNIVERSSTFSPWNGRLIKVCLYILTTTDGLR